jgi:hypothetical protein
MYCIAVAGRRVCGDEWHSFGVRIGTNPHPGCATRPWASEYNRFAVNLTRQVSGIEEIRRLSSAVKAWRGVAHRAILPGIKREPNSIPIPGIRRPLCRPQSVCRWQRHTTRARVPGAGCLEKPFATPAAARPRPSSAPRGRRAARLRRSPSAMIAQWRWPGSPVSRGTQMPSRKMWPSWSCLSSCR